MEQLSPEAADWYLFWYILGENNKEKYNADTLGWFESNRKTYRIGTFEGTTKTKTPDK